MAKSVHNKILYIKILCSTILYIFTTEFSINRIKKMIDLERLVSLLTLIMYLSFVRTKRRNALHKGFLALRGVFPMVRRPFWRVVEMAAVNASKIGLKFFTRVVEYLRRDGINSLLLNILCSSWEFCNAHILLCAYIYAYVRR